jgi:hypothetical protein
MSSEETPTSVAGVEFACEANENATAEAKRDTEQKAVAEAQREAEENTAAGAKRTAEDNEKAQFVISSEEGRTVFQLVFNLVVLWLLPIGVNYLTPQLQTIIVCVTRCVCFGS